MSKLKKAALFTDIHFGKRNNSEEHNQDCLDFIKWFCDQVQTDPTIDHIWFLGDWHEHRAAINAFTLQRSYTAAKMLNALQLPIMFLIGNHDLAFRNSRTTFTTEIFEPFENFKLINEIEVIDSIEGGVLAIPYLREDEYPTILDHKNVPVVMGHLELKGFRVSGASNILEHGPEANTFFKKQKRVFSGHFHQRQEQGNVHYIGNIAPMDFSDTNDTKRGMAVYNFETDKLDYIDWPNCPRYIKATLSEVLENPKKILVKGARVRIEVDTDITYDESNQIKESLAVKYGLREITLNEAMTIDVQLSDDEIEIEELKLETTNEVIQELLKRIKDDSVDTDLLLKIYNSVNLNSFDNVVKAASVEFMDMTMQNFLSYGNGVTSVNLNFEKPTMVMGRNYDSIVEGQIDSNGAGKSTILNALLLCLYGKNLIPSKLDKQINKSNGKNMMISVIFKADGIYYKVERYRKNKIAGGDGVRLYVNDKEPVFTKDHDKTPDSVANCEAKIASIIGIPYEMFIRIVVFSATHDPFLSLPASHASQANQRDIIEELFGLTELTYKAEKLKELLSASKTEFKNLLEINERLEAERERHNTQIKGNTIRLDEWNNTRAAKISELETQVSELESIDLQNSIDGFEEIEKKEKELIKIEKNIPVLELELKNVRSLVAKHAEWVIWNNARLEAAQKSYDKLRNYDFDKLRKVRNEYLELSEDVKTYTAESKLLNTQITNIKSVVQKKVEERSKLDTEIEHLKANNCPYCKQRFADAKSKIESNEETITILTTDIDKLYDEQDSLKAKIEELSIVWNEANNRLDEFNTLPDNMVYSNIDVLEAERDITVRNVEEYKSAINPHVVGEDNLTEDDILETLNDLKDKASKIRTKIQMAKEFIHPTFKNMADVQGHKLRIENLKSKIEEAQEQINPFYDVLDSLNNVVQEELKTDKINQLDKEIKHQDFLVKLLTKKDSFIRKALLNKNIPLLNTRLRYYLDRVGLPHKVTFNEEMGVDIAQFGSEWEYGLFSSGQKARVNICLAFAFRDVLQSRFGKTNLCILDECLDTGLGAVGVSLVAKMIKVIALENKLSMFVISHRDEVANMFDSKLEIELRNGFSTIL